MGQGATELSCESIAPFVSSDRGKIVINCYLGIYENEGGAAYLP